MSYFRPKESMCRTCVHMDANCMGLPFYNMPVMETLPTGTKIVKCSEYQPTEAQKQTAALKSKGINHET